MKLFELLDEAKQGNLESCKSCPWSPAELKSYHVAFGVSCREHGVDYKSSSDAVSVSISQDPANTTPEKIERLCAVHNSQEHKDKTAQNWLELWKAAVTRDASESHDPYLGRHYWTNAIMHGAPKEHRKHMRKAQRQCSHVLREQIELLSPKVVVACGEVAANSLFDAHFISQHWSEFRERFTTEVYTEITDGTIFYCTYHSAAGAVNRGAAQRHDHKLTEEGLTQKLGDLSKPAAAQGFLEKHCTSSARDRGMRLLLLHWLDIGDAIRKAHAGGVNVK